MSKVHKVKVTALFWQRGFAAEHRLIFIFFNSLKLTFFGEINR